MTSSWGIHYQNLLLFRQLRYPLVHKSVPNFRLLPKNHRSSAVINTSKKFQQLFGKPFSLKNFLRFSWSYFLIIFLFYICQIVTVHFLLQKLQKIAIQTVTVNVRWTPLFVDAATSSFTRPNVARVCVEVDLLKSFPSRVWVDMGDGNGFWQALIPEKLPSYCGHCYRQGHEEGLCHVKHPELRPSKAQLKPKTFAVSEVLGTEGRLSSPRKWLSQICSV